MEIEIEPGSADNAATIATLFVSYCEFYGVVRDLEAAQRYVRTQIETGATQFFLATRGGPAGFAHLLPSFDTLGMRPSWILEDLYVAEDRRREGVASALLQHVERFALASGASRLSLTTAYDNVTAQRVYVANGWTHDTVFRVYHRILE